MCIRDSGTAYLKGWGKDLPWTIIGLAAMGGVFLAACYAADTAVTVLLPVVIYAVARGTGPLQKALANPTMVYLGKTSYTFYMVQLLVIVYWRRLLPAAVDWSVAAKVGFFLMLWIVNYAIAHLVWSLIEEPSRRAVLQLGSGRKHELARN